MTQRSVDVAPISDTLAGSLRPKRTFLQNVGWFIRYKPLGVFGGVIASVLIFVAIFAGLLSTHDYTFPDSSRILAPPSSDMWLGGDSLGRDMYSRILHGARISLYVGILSSFIGTTIGMMVGIISVHYGGKMDLIIQRIVDAMIAFPGLILAIAIMAALGASINNVVIALSIAYIPSATRVLRSQALAIKEMDYILAARALGVGDWRIMIRHTIPNCFSLYIVIVTLHLGGAIISEAGLSFLGIGAPPQEPSWGAMLTGASQNVRIAPWQAVFPGVCIALVVFGWNLLGDAMRDVLDPRLRGTT